MNTQNTIEKKQIEEKGQKLTKSHSEFPGLYFEPVATLCKRFILVGHSVKWGVTPCSAAVLQCVCATLRLSERREM